MAGLGSSPEFPSKASESPQAESRESVTLGLRERIDDLLLNQDREKLRDVSISDIRHSVNVITDSPPEGAEVRERIKNVKLETARRLNAYTSDFDSRPYEEGGGWYTLDYKSVGGQAHEMDIGLGDILLDPDIKRIEVYRDGEEPFIAERGISSNGRVSFLRNGNYVATFTGDKFRIVEEDGANVDTLKELEMGSGLRDSEKSKRILDRYVLKLDSEDSFRSKGRESYVEPLILDKKDAHEIIRLALNLKDSLEDQNISPSYIISAFQNLSGPDFAEARRRAGGGRYDAGGRNLKIAFEALGLDEYSQKNDLISQIRSQVNASNFASTYPRLSNVFGHDRNQIINTLIQLAALESGFKPFNWSRTYCMGFFQFNMRNTLYYNGIKRSMNNNRIDSNPFSFNPLEPRSAVEGVLRLWNDNVSWGNLKTVDSLIAAHNTGAGNWNTDQGKKFLALVKRAKPDRFSDFENDEILAGRA